MPIPTMPSRYATMVTSIAICEPVIFSPPSGNTYPHMKHALLFHKPLYTCITRINLIHYRNKYSTRQRINPVKCGNDVSAVMRRSCCGGRGKIRCGFGNYGREEALFTRWFRPEMEDHTRKSIKESRRSAPAFPQRRQKFTH